MDSDFFFLKICKLRLVIKFMILYVSYGLCNLWRFLQYLQGYIIKESCQGNDAAAKRRRLIQHNFVMKENLLCF